MIGVAEMVALARSASPWSTSSTGRASCNPGRIAEVLDHAPVAKANIARGAVIASATRIFSAVQW